MITIPAFHVALARLVDAPQLPPRLLLSFQWPRRLGIAPGFAPEQVSLDIVDAGLLLRVDGRGYLLFPLHTPTTVPGASKADEPNDSGAYARSASDVEEVAGDLAHDDETIDRDAFMLALAQRRALTVCAFDAQEEAVLALEFNL